MEKGELADGEGGKGKKSEVRVDDGRVLHPLRTRKITRVSMRSDGVSCLARGYSNNPNVTP